MSKYNRIVFFLLFLSLLPQLQAQHVVHGQVFDLSTFEGVRGCNVFIVGTTLGAPTDSAGYFSFEVPQKGNYELVFSHIAYRPEIIDLIVSGDSVKLDPMPLNLDTRFVNEVVVTGKKDRKWQRQYDRFIKYAMGRHYREKKVKILNPYVVDFKYSGKGMLTEAQPFTLSMQNDYTGYEINFLVQRIFLSKSNQFVVGYPGFTQLEANDEQKLLEWEKNRERAFKGSLRHIFKSILEKSIGREGMDMQLIDKEKSRSSAMGTAAKILPIEIDNSINLTAENLRKHIKVLDTENPLIKKLVFDQLLNVIYHKENDTYGNPQRTMIEALEGEIMVYNNGILVNPTSVKLYGYLASEGLYEMLPFGYELTK